MMLNKGLFSSNTDLWATPDDFFNKVKTVFNFDLDVCAIKENAKCDKYYTPEDDGLSKDWFGVCWLNPPYGRKINKWLKKAYESTVINNATVVCLVPARTDTKWWHDYCAKGEVYFIKGRLKFGDAKDSAPFPSALVVFRRGLKDVIDCV